MAGDRVDLRGRRVSISGVVGYAVTLRIAATSDGGAYSWSLGSVAARVYGPGGIVRATFNESLDGTTLVLTLPGDTTTALGPGASVWTLDVGGEVWIGGRLSLDYPGNDVPAGDANQTIGVAVAPYTINVEVVGSGGSGGGGGSTTSEEIVDAIASALVEGANVDLTYNDPLGQITIAVPGLGTAAFTNTPAGGLVGVTATQTLTGKTLTSPVVNGGTADGTTINDPVIRYDRIYEAGTSRIATDTDASKVVVFTSASPVEYELSAGMTVGTEIFGMVVGAGLVTVTGASGVNVNGTPGLKTTATYARFRAYQYDTNEWIVDGDLAVADAGGGTTDPVVAAGNGYVLFNGPHTSTASVDVATGVQGNSLSTPAAGVTKPSGDMGVAIRLAVGDGTPTAIGTIIGQYDTTGNMRAWELRQEISGAFSFQWSPTGVSPTGTTGGIGTSTAMAWLKPLEFLWLWASIDVNDGAGGSDVRFFTSRQDRETAAEVTDWELVNTQHFAYTTAVFATSTAPFTVGQRATATSSQPWKGWVKAIDVRNGIGASGVFGGTSVLAFDTTDIPAEGASTFVAASGQTITVNRAGATSDDIMMVPNTTPAYTRVFNGFFPIAPDLQDATSSTVRNTWAARGANAFIRSSSDISTDPTAWSNAIQADGRFKQIRHPRATMHGSTRGLMTAINETSIPSSLLAYTNRDEPEGVGSQITYETIVANRNLIRSALPGAVVTAAYATSMNQNDVRYYPSDDPDGEAAAGEPWMRKYFRGNDIIIGFRYPYNTGGTRQQFLDAVDRMGLWQEIEWQKPFLAYVETSDYNTSDANAAPTAAQFRGMVWAAICKGARGILYFPERVTPSFVADATPAGIITEMPLVAAQIQAIASALQGPIDPPSCAVTCSSTALMRTWRTSLTHHVFVVHNFTSSAINGVSVKLHGIPASATSVEVVGESRTEALTAGVLTDDFPADTPHIYRVAV